MDDLEALADGQHAGSESQGNKQATGYAPRLSPLCCLPPWCGSQSDAEGHGTDIRRIGPVEVDKTVRHQRETSDARGEGHAAPALGLTQRQEQECTRAKQSERQRHRDQETTLSGALEETVVRQWRLRRRVRYGPSVQNAPVARASKWVGDKGVHRLTPEVESVGAIRAHGLAACSATLDCDKRRAARMEQERAGEAKRHEQRQHCQQRSPAERNQFARTGESDDEADDE